MVARAPARAERPPWWPILVTGLGCGIAAAGIATLATRWQVAALGMLVVFGMVALAKDRQSFFMALTVASMQVTLHKAFSRVAGDNSASVVALYLTTVDVAIVVLFFIWFWRGDLFRVLPGVLRHPVVLLALLAVAGEAASFTGAVEKDHVLWFVARDLWMVLVLIYAAGTLRTKTVVPYVALATFSIQIVQCAFVVAQTVTHRGIGAALFGERPAGNLDTKWAISGTDSGGALLIRPTGTLVHPDFLAAFLIPCILLTAALAVFCPDRNLRWAARLVFPFGVAAVALTLGRAAIVGLVFALVLAAVLMVRRGILSPAVARRAALVTAVVLLAAAGPVIYKVSKDFSRFGQEYQARGELSNVAWHMFLTHPLTGIGTGNFVKLEDQYSAHTLIFDGNPVHSIYMLVLSETGLIGSLTWLASVISILYFGRRATTHPDRLLRTVAIGLFAAICGLYVEEIVTFSLRLDGPLEMYWFVIGWLVAIGWTVKPAAPLPAPPSKEESV